MREKTGNGEIGTRARIEAGRLQLLIEPQQWSRQLFGILGLVQSLRKRPRHHADSLGPLDAVLARNMAVGQAGEESEEAEEKEEAEAAAEEPFRQKKLKKPARSPHGTRSASAEPRADKKKPAPRKVQKPGKPAAHLAHPELDEAKAKGEKKKKLAPKAPAKKPAAKGSKKK